MMKDYLVKATTYNGMVRAYAISSTNTVGEACRRQDTWATASAALGRTITITAMMGAMLKGDDSITVKVEGNGPIGAIIADGNADGHVRGYVTNPHVDFDLNEKGKLDHGNFQTEQQESNKLRPVPKGKQTTNWRNFQQNLWIVRTKPSKNGFY